MVKEKLKNKKPSNEIPCPRCGCNLIDSVPSKLDSLLKPVFCKGCKYSAYRVRREEELKKLRC